MCEGIRRFEGHHNEALDKRANSSGLDEGFVAVVAQLCGELVYA